MCGTRWGLLHLVWTCCTSGGCGSRLAAAPRFYPPAIIIIHYRLPPSRAYAVRAPARPRVVVVGRSGRGVLGLGVAPEKAPLARASLFSGATPKPVRAPAPPPAAAAVGVVGACSHKRGREKADNDDYRTHPQSAQPPQGREPQPPEVQQVHTRCSSPHRVPHTDPPRATHRPAACQQ